MGTQLRSVHPKEGGQDRWCTGRGPWSPLPSFHSRRPRGHAVSRACSPQSGAQRGQHREEAGRGKTGGAQGRSTGEMTPELSWWIPRGEGNVCSRKKRPTPATRDRWFASLPGGGSGWGNVYGGAGRGSALSPHILRQLLLPTPKSHWPISHLLPGHWGGRSLSGGNKRLSLGARRGQGLGCLTLVQRTQLLPPCPPS